MGRMVTVWTDQGAGHFGRRVDVEEMSDQILADELEWRVESMATTIGSAEADGPDAIALAKEVKRRAYLRRA